MNRIKEQEELFYEIKCLDLNIYNLSGYVQNDFTLMLSDEYTTKSHIKEFIPIMLDDFNETIEKLNNLRDRCEQLMESYCE